VDSVALELQFTVPLLSNRRHVSHRHYHSCTSKHPKIEENLIKVSVLVNGYI